jgi:hypothetical protein
VADHGAVVRLFDQGHYGGPSTTGARLPEEDGLPLGDVAASWDASRTLFTRLVGWDPLTGLAEVPSADRLAVGYRPG